MNALSLLWLGDGIHDCWSAQYTSGDWHCHDSPCLTACRFGYTGTASITKNLRTGRTTQVGWERSIWWLPASDKAYDEIKCVQLPGWSSHLECTRKAQPSLKDVNTSSWSTPTAILCLFSLHRQLNYRIHLATPLPLQFSPQLQGRSPPWSPDFKQSNSFSIFVGFCWEYPWSSHFCWICRTRPVNCSENSWWFQTSRIRSFHFDFSWRFLQ